MLLRLVSLRLRDVIGEAGKVCRLGGDEFEIVLPSTSNKEDLSKLAQGVIDSLSRPYTINGNAVSIGASVGIVTSYYDDRTADDLMRDADLALYAAKAAGKGCFRFFAPEMHEAARERQVMESRFSRGDREECASHEPSVHALTEDASGFEALAVGTTRSTAQSVPPRSFRSPRSSASSMKSANGCFAPLAPKRHWPKHLTVAVNLSPVQFKSHDLPTLVRTVLSENASPPSASSWRLPRAATDNDEHVHNMIASRENIEFKLALDYFVRDLRSRFRQPGSVPQIKITNWFVRGANAAVKPQGGADPRDGWACP